MNLKVMHKWKSRGDKVKWVKIYVAIGMAIMGFCLAYNSMASDEKERKAVEAAKRC